MSIAANAPWSFPKLRRSAMFVRRFMESLDVPNTRIGTMNRIEDEDEHEDEHGSWKGHFRCDPLPSM